LRSVASKLPLKTFILDSDLSKHVTRIITVVVVVVVLVVVAAAAVTVTVITAAVVVALVSRHEVYEVWYDYIVVLLQKCYFT
jgi:hypothetical protein